MSQGTTIEWTDATWNPVRGCTRISEGCRHCYAEQMAARFSGRNPQTGKPMWGAGFATSKGLEPRWTGKVALIPDQLDWPLRWKGSKKAKAEGRPSRIFVNSTSDLFHEKLSDEDIDKVFAVMALAPQHTFQILTKRADRMRAYFAAEHPAPNVKAWQARVSEAIDVLVPDRTSASVDAKSAVVHHAPLPNVWLGVSTENQDAADERIPHLLKTPAAVRFISAEPLIGPIDLTMIPTGEKVGDNVLCENALTGPPDMQPGEWLDWVITGGESGDGARPMHPAWARSLRDQCAEAGVAFFFKQWGGWTETRVVAGGDLGGDMRRGLVRHVCADRENDGHYRIGDVYMRRVDKAEAGALLDGQLHREWPHE